MAEGCLIRESLADEEVIGMIDVRRTDTVEVSEAANGQPDVWTLLWFHAPDSEADAVADKLSRSLKTPGWYCDYTTEDGWKYVVFSGRVFRYPLGDETAREEAKAHGRRLGVPEHQLDWPS